MCPYFIHSITDSILCFMNKLFCWWFCLFICYLIFFPSMHFMAVIFLKEARALDATKIHVLWILGYKLISDSLQPSTQLCTTGIKWLEKANLRLSVCNGKAFLIVNMDLQMSRRIRLNQWVSFNLISLRINTLYIS